MAKKKDESRPVLPLVRVAPLGELNVYPIYEHELETLGRGSTGSIYLNFSLALLPLSGSFLITLLSTAISTNAGLIFFICSSLISLLFGLLCLFLWWKTHINTKTLVEQIRNRMPPPMVRGPAEEATVSEATAAEYPATSLGTKPGSQPPR